MQIDEEKLYKNVLGGTEQGRKQLFEAMLPKLQRIAIRYAKATEDVDDILQESFIRIFSSISSFSWQGNGSFEAWMKRIVVNQSINLYHKQKRNKEIGFDDEEWEYLQNQHTTQEPSAQHGAVPLSEQELMQLIDTIPVAFAIVFKLFAIEGYKHKEIAHLLQIDEKTSTTRYLRARKLLTQKVNQVLTLRKTSHAVR